MQDAMNGISNGRVYAEFLVHPVNPFGTIEALRNHIHLHNRAFDAVAFSYHHPQGAVSTVGAIGCDEQITEVRALFHITIQFMNCCQKPLHFL